MKLLVAVNLASYWKFSMGNFVSHFALLIEKDLEFDLDGAHVRRHQGEKLPVHRFM